MIINRVALDFGHGGGKAGAVYAGVQEKVVNLQLGHKIYSALHSLSESSETIKVLLTRDADEHIPLSVRYQLINQYHSAKTINLVVSVHFNAAPSVPSAKGFEVYYLHGSEKGLAASEAIITHVRDDGFSVRGQGYKTTASLGRKLAMIHKTKPPAVLIEAGFLSNDADRSDSTNTVWQDKMADAVAKGIWAFLRNENQIEEAVI